MFRPGHRGVTSVLRTIRGIPEPVAHAAHGFDRRGGGARGDELRAQAGEVHIDGARLDEAVTAPDEIEQLLATEHAAGRPDEGGEELELLARQLDGPALHADFEALAVDLELAGAKLQGSFGERGVPRAARDGADARDQLTR